MTCCSHVVRSFSELVRYLITISKDIKKGYKANVKKTHVSKENLMAFMHAVFVAKNLHLDHHVTIIRRYTQTPHTFVHYRNVTTHVKVNPHLRNTLNITT